MTEKMTLSRWYGTSLRIPKYENIRFGSFVASCIGIVTSIFKKESGKQVRVRFTKAGTASADTNNLIININAKYLVGEVPEVKRKGLPSDEAISMVLGILVHESAHFAYSPKTLLVVSDHIRSKAKAPFIQEVAMVVGNIVEDIFIEAQVERDVPSLHWMLNCSNEILFSDKDAKERIEKAADITDAPEEKERVSDVLNLLILAKVNEALVGLSPYLQALFTQSRSATEMVSLDDRFNLCVSIYDEVMRNIPPSVAQQCQKDKELMDELKKMLEGLSNRFEKLNREGKEQDKRKEELSTTVASVGNIVDQALEYLDDGIVSTVPDHDEHEDKLVMYIEKPLMAGRAEIEIDKRYMDLAEVARQRSTVNRPYGENRTSGHKIRNLWRINTDQKIFSEPITMREFKPMQVVILVDTSGSMNGADVRSGMKVKSRVLAAAEAALGAAYGLTEGRCEVAVYAHTADTTPMRECLIFRAKGFNEGMGDLSLRLNDLVYARPHANNKDGYAIAYVGQRFQSASKRKLLIVISDGQPSGYDYGGEPARVHSRDEVNRLRARGIDVLSISITEEARDANDFIYGKQNNVYNQDPNIIHKVVESLII